MPPRSPDAVLLAAPRATPSTALARAHGAQSAHALTIPRDTPPPEQNPALSYLLRLGESSRRTQRGALRWLAWALGGGGDEDDYARFPWGDITYVIAQAARMKMEGAFSFVTANRHLAALRGVTEQAWILKLMSADEYLRIRKVPLFRGKKLPAGRELAPKELAALFATCRDDEKPTGRRDAALLSLLRFGGLRREEAVEALLEDYIPTTGELRVTGKGTKERNLYLGKHGTALVAAWLALRPKGDGAILTPTDEVRMLNPQTVADILARRAKQAALSEPFSAHDFRRTYISELLARGVDISTVQKLVGHSNTATTQRYDRRGEDEKMNAVDLLGFEE